MLEHLGSILYVFSPFTFVVMMLGVFGGLVVGAIPGLTSTMAVALLVPVTYGMSSELGLVLLVAVYIGAISGGLVAATLINIPGTPSSVATTFDAYPMAKRGEAGRALAFGVWASFVGGLLSCFALILVAPVLGRFALHFASFEYFALVVFTLTCIIAISRKSLVKGFIAASIGMLMSTVGLSETDGVTRFTFGLDSLQAGFSVMPVLIGMYAISQILSDVKTIDEQYKITNANFTVREFIQTAKESMKYTRNIIRSSLIGIGIGILPGVGPGLSNIVAYSQAKAAAPDPSTFGTGDPNGIIASESANNATMGGAMIPLLTLGIPGDSTTMMMLGAFMIHGIQPGPLLIRDHGSLVMIIMAAFVVSNFLMLILQVQFIRVLIKALTIPRPIMYPIILVMCVIGCFAMNSQMSDVWIFFFLGLLGAVFTKLEFPLLPLVLGLILGKMAETEFRLSWVSGGDSLAGFLDRPIALFFLAVSLLSVVYSQYAEHKRKKRLAALAS